MTVRSNNVKIHVSHLQKSFGELDVLKDISTDIYEGEVVVVLGPSGSGKSTFLRCLNRLEEFQSGEVIVDGYNMADKKPYTINTMSDGLTSLTFAGLTELFKDRKTALSFAAQLAEQVSTYSSPS